MVHPYPYRYAPLCFFVNSIGKENDKKRPHQGDDDPTHLWFLIARSFLQ